MFEYAKLNTENRFELVVRIYGYLLFLLTISAIAYLSRDVSHFAATLFFCSLALSPPLTLMLFRGGYDESFAPTRAAFRCIVCTAGCAVYVNFVFLEAPDAMVGLWFLLVPIVQWPLIAALELSTRFADRVSSTLLSPKPK